MLSKRSELQTNSDTRREQVRDVCVCGRLKSSNTTRLRNVFTYDRKALFCQWKPTYGKCVRNTVTYHIVRVVTDSSGPSQMIKTDWTVSVMWPPSSRDTAASFMAEGEMASLHPPPTHAQKSCWQRCRTLPQSVQTTQCQDLKCSVFVVHFYSNVPTAGLNINNDVEQPLGQKSNQLTLGPRQTPNSTAVDPIRSEPVENPSCGVGVLYRDYARWNSSRRGDHWRTSPDICFHRFICENNWCALAAHVPHKMSAYWDNDKY